MNSKLQDYLATYSLTGMKEKDIVEKYIIDYGLENEYATMLINLLMSKENKWANKVREIERTILSYNQGGSGAIHNKKYTIKKERTIEAIGARVGQLNRSFSFIGNKTFREDVKEDDINKIKELFPLYGAGECRKQLPHINVNMIYRIAKEYNLSHTCAKKVICIETGKVYESAGIAATELNIFNVDNVCRKNQECAGGYHWSYLDDIDNIEKLSKLYKGKDRYSKKQISSNRKAVLCIETNKRYESAAQAMNELHISNVDTVCRGYQKTAGGYHWKYVEE